MKLASIVTIFSLVTVFGSRVLPSNAADSRWLLCDNGGLAINLLEHRSADGLGRATSLTLLFGGYTFFGQLTDTDAGSVLLIGTPQDNTNFKGDISVDHLKNVVSLKGILNLNVDRFNINTQLKCKEMRSNLSSGHQ